MCLLEVDTNVIGSGNIFRRGEVAGDDRSGKTGAVPYEAVRHLSWSAGTRGSTRLCSAANHGDTAWDGNVDGGGKPVGVVSHHREPASGVQQIRRVLADISELQTFNR